MRLTVAVFVCCTMLLTGLLNASAEDWEGAVPEANGEKTGEGATGSVDFFVGDIGDGTYTVSPCTAEVMTFATVLALYPGVSARADSEAKVGDWYVVFCPYGDFDVQTLWGVFEVGEPPGGQTMLDAVTRELTVSLPGTVVNPPESAFQLVGVETWLWVDEAEVDDVVAEFCLGTYACATLWADFAGLEFEVETGDGNERVTVSCPDGGRAYDTGRSEVSQFNLDHCGWVFENRGQLEINASTSWDLRWSCMWDSDGNGELDSTCGGSGLGTLVRDEAPRDFEVRSGEAIVRSGG